MLWILYVAVWQNGLLHYHFKFDYHCF